MVDSYTQRYGPPLRNVVYAGAGLGGISYLGAQKALEEYNLFDGIGNCAGSSAGGLFSSLASCEIKSSVIIPHVMETNFASLLDTRSDNLLSKSLEFYREKGMYKGEALYHWIGDTFDKLIGNRDMTYGDIKEIHGKNNITTLSNITKGRSEHFSSIDTPEVPVVVGNRITAGVPIMFSPVEMNGDYYVDGAYFSPYPFYMFSDDIAGTLGWKVINSASDDKGPGLTAYLKQLIYSPSIELARWQHIPHSKGHHIEIDAQGIDILNFNIPLDEKKVLVNAGYQATKDYLRLFGV